MDSMTNSASVSGLTAKLLCYNGFEASAWPSTQADAVERFVVVHGQIILNQFKNFPKKSVANSAFVGGLKAKMELRRHCKLYTISKAKARRRVRLPPLQVTGSPALLTWRLSAQWSAT